MSWFSAQVRKRREAVNKVPHFCTECGNLFSAWRNVQRYCGKRCAKNAYEKRNPEIERAARKAWIKRDRESNPSGDRTHANSIRARIVKARLTLDIVTAPLVRERFACTITIANQVLSRLCRAGVLKREYRGHYRFVGKCKPASA